MTSFLNAASFSAYFLTKVRAWSSANMLLERTSNDPPENVIVECTEGVLSCVLTRCFGVRGCVDMMSKWMC